jgi:putative Holliday junction resolvase
LRIIAIDLGLKRIGVAYSPDGAMVTPLPAIERKNRSQAAAAVKTAISEWNAEAVVIGIPLGGSSEEEMRRRISHFMNLVAFEGPLYYQDESDSSLEAEELMRGDIRYRRDGRVDSLSAMIILQRWIDSKQNRA